MSQHGNRDGMALVSANSQAATAKLAQREIVSLTRLRK